MKKLFYKEILHLIKQNSGKPERDAFLNSYLGNDHVRYPISTAPLRAIARDWMRNHKDLTPEDFTNLLTALIKGPSFTEKIMAGIMMGYSSKAQRKFDPGIFDEWLEHLVGWAEVDAVCSGDFPATQIPEDWTRWKKLLTAFTKSTNIQKRRASLVLLCSPVSRVKDERLAETAFKNIDRLKSEKEVLITKAVSWLLRSMIKHHRDAVSNYVEENQNTLPKIAVRETLVKLDTGKKTKKKA